MGWHTLQKILNHSEPPGYRQSRPRPKRKLAEFLPIVHQILEADRQMPKKQRHTSRRIFERLRDEHGFSGGWTVVKDAALGMAACSQGRKVRFFRVTELITLLPEAKEERVFQRLRQQLARLALLVLDELGYVPASKAGAELLFDVIATAYERYSLPVTTNLPFEN